MRDTESEPVIAGDFKIIDFRPAENLQQEIA
jgi:hypothetical protein